MVSLNVQAPDGKSLTVQVPDGFDPSKYGDLADDALSHYTSNNPQSEGPATSFLRAIGNQLPLGAQFAALASKLPYSQQMAANNAQLAADKAQHPVAYGAGAGIGALGPGLIPAVGEAMAANPMTAGAILGGTNAINLMFEANKINNASVTL